MAKGISRYEITSETESKDFTSHGEGRRFDPCHSKVLNHSRKAKKPLKAPEFRGLPPSSISYLSLPINTPVPETRGKRGVNGRTPKRGAA